MIFCLFSDFFGGWVFSPVDTREAWVGKRLWVCGATRPSDYVASDARVDGMLLRVVRRIVYVSMHAATACAWIRWHAATACA